MDNVGGKTFCNNYIQVALAKRYGINKTQPAQGGLE